MNNQIKRPYCNKSFEPTGAYKHELEEKLLLETQQKHKEEVDKLKLEKQELSIAKDKELEKAKKRVAETVRTDVEKKLSVTEAVKNIEKERDALAGELKSKEAEKQLLEKSLQIIDTIYE